MPIAFGYRGFSLLLGMADKLYFTKEKRLSILVGFPDLHLSPAAAVLRPP